MKHHCPQVVAEEVGDLGRDRTGMVAMVLLAAIDTETEGIVDDYLETMRIGKLQPASAAAEPKVDSVCRAHGTTTEGAFRSALAGLDLPGLLDAAGVTEADRRRLVSWRGSIAFA